MKKRLSAITRGLNAVIKVKVSTLLALLCVAAFSVTAIAAATTKITATLSADITVKYNGVVQAMKDGNVAVVYPLSYKGTTYLPIRAVSDMMGIAVAWEGKSKTVLLGRTGELRLVDACEKRTGIFGEIWADKMSSAIELPDGNATRAFNSAIRVKDVNTAAKSGVFQLNGVFSSMNTTFYAQKLKGDDRPFTLRIYDYDKKLVLAERVMQPGQFVEVKGIELAGVKNLQFEAVCGVFTEGIALFLDPMVK
jgi:hypothetical protein